MSLIYMGYIVPATILIPLFTAIRVKRNTLNTGLLFLLIYLVVTLCVNVASKVMSINHIPNLPLIHIDTIFEIVLLLFYFSSILNGKIVKLWLKTVAILFPVCCGINFIFFQSIHNFNTYTRPLGALILISFCIVYWWEYSNKDPDNEWSHIADNWFVSGILFYFSGALLLFIFSNYLAAFYDSDTNIFIWNLHGTLLISFYLFFTKGFLLCKR